MSGKDDTAFSVTQENEAEQKEEAKPITTEDTKGDAAFNVTHGVNTSVGSPASGIIDIIATGIDRWNTDSEKLTTALKKAAPRWSEFAGFMRGRFGDNLLELGTEAAIFSAIDTVIESATEADGVVSLTNGQVWYIVGKLSVFAQAEITKFFSRLVPFFGQDLIDMLKAAQLL